MIRTGLFSYPDQIDRLSHVKVIALTGGIGSGKSLVANYFFSLGAEVIDADQLARAAIERGSDGFDQVVATFGDEILKDGDICLLYTSDAADD